MVRAGRHIIYGVYLSSNTHESVARDDRALINDTVPTAPHKAPRADSCPELSGPDNDYVSSQTFSAALILHLAARPA